MTTVESTDVSVPEPTTDLERAERDLERTGIAVIDDALEADRLAVVREVLYRTARTDRASGRAEPFHGDGPGPPLQWVVNLPSRDPVFLDLVEHPIALRFVRQAIGWPALLSNISAIIAGPGNEPQFLHADMTYMPEPWGRLQVINCVWCVDDFTEETGANSTTDRTRAGIFAWYTLPIDLPQENWWLTLDQSIRRYGSGELKVLFGYKITAGFGLEFGTSPE